MTYYPDVMPIKRSIRNVGFGSAPRFATEIRNWKQEVAVER